MIVESDRTFPRESTVCAYWLTRCEGFTVRAGKRSLGVVESIAGDVPLGRADTLELRTRRRRRQLDAAQVTGVVPARQLLLATREPGRRRVRPAAAALAHGLVLAAAWLFRLSLALGAVTRDGMALAGARVTALAEQWLPRARAGASALRAVLVDLACEAERLTVLEGRAQAGRDERPSGGRAGSG